MKKHFLLSVIILISCFHISFSQTKISLTKEKVKALYDSLFLGSEIDSIIWNGNIKKCICGSLDKEIYVKVENRVNFFRLVNGLNKVSINDSLNGEAQAGALFIKANNVLTHEAAPDMKCYSKVAANGCEKSCLGMSDFENYPGISFITGFINDYGDENYFLGHRRWLLYSKLNEIGYGATDKTEVLLVTDGVSFNQKAEVDFIAYPWSGYVPVNLVYPKWSFSIPEDKEVDFSTATITVTNSSGANLAIQRFEEYKDFLDHTITWKVNSLFTEEEETYCKNSIAERGLLNKKFKVTIRNVKVNGSLKKYEYFVEFI